MAKIKTLAYDWFGGNESLFRELNGLHNDLSDNLAVLFNHIGDHHNFPYIMAGLAVVAFLDLLIRYTKHKPGKRMRAAAWLGVFVILGISYVFQGAAIHFLKDYFAYPRPYVLWPQDVHVLEIRTDNYMSFPSGHAAFVAMLAVGLEPVLGGGIWGIMATFAVVGVCWARIASGVHFPADVLGGVIVAVVITGLMRSIIYYLMRVLFGIKC